MVRSLVLGVSDTAAGEVSKLVGDQQFAIRSSQFVGGVRAQDVAPSVDHELQIANCELQSSVSSTLRPAHNRRS